MNDRTQNAEDEPGLAPGFCITRSLDDAEPQVLSPAGDTLPLSEARRLWPMAFTDLEDTQPPADGPRCWADMEVEDITRGMERRQAARRALLHWVDEHLEEGVDFGRIHVVKKEKCPDGRYCTNQSHFSKPSLWKPGAEKIAFWLSMQPVWPELEAELGHLKAGSTLTALRCVLIDEYNNVASEGVGARGLAQDHDNVNKALKMAKKSGLIDAVLGLGLSDIFTQDLSDEDAPGEDATSPLNDEGQAYLRRKAHGLFGEDADTVLESLARNRFRISNGNWREIPAFRMQDAVRSLEEKASEAGV